MKNEKLLQITGLFSSLVLLSTLIPDIVIQCFIPLHNLFHNTHYIGLFSRSLEMTFAFWWFLFNGFYGFILHLNLFHKVEFYMLPVYVPSILFHLIFLTITFIFARAIITREHNKLSRLTIIIGIVFLAVFAINTIENTASIIYRMIAVVIKT